MADMPDLDVSFNQKGENDAPMEAGFPIMTIATESEKPGTAAPEMATTSGDSFNQKGGNSASMDSGIPIMPVATGSEKPGIAALESATTSGKGEKPEIEAEPPSNTYVEGLEKDSKDGVCPKKIDADQQGLSAVGRELKEEASPEALRKSEEEQKQSKANSLLKRDSQDTVDDTFAPQAKKPKLFKTQDVDQEI
ncbi:nucleolar and coiled-body phosphoprotein 1-like [Drosophila suzukii]|uniref:Nucleolar and coiled-body phosphoprotein 1-like n=1 Tax=Drosophila suzukii TaxID=28584 RepID=A0AB40ADK5_DROSZ